jgi:effector-binding domain-containing protein
MTHHVRVCELYAVPTAVMRARISPQRLARWLDRAFSQVGERLGHDGITAIGPAFACYTAGSERYTAGSERYTAGSERYTAGSERYPAGGEAIEVEAGFPVSAAVPGDGLVLASGLPGGPAAIIVHYGPLESVDETYRRIGTWLDGHGLRIRGRHWERYLIGAATKESDSSQWRTEIVVPFRYTRVENRRMRAGNQLPTPAAVSG